MKKHARFGSWPSKITAELAAQSARRLSEVSFGEDDRALFWIERRPEEEGRSVITCRSSEGEIFDVIPSVFNAQTRVHEYGGGGYTVAGKQVYFCNFPDYNIYRQSVSGEGVPSKVTNTRDIYYADLVFDKERRRVLCVVEDHTSKQHEPKNSICAINIETGRRAILLSGNDFYSSPRLSPDGSRLAWLTWNHPNMPFFACELWTGELSNDEGIGNLKKVSGGDFESVADPKWSPGGVLYFVTDKERGWWNIHRYDSAEGRTECVHLMKAEFSEAQWVFKISLYSFLSEDSILCAFFQGGTMKLAVLDTRSGQLDMVSSNYTKFAYVTTNQKGSSAFIASSPEEFPCIAGYKRGVIKRIYEPPRSEPLPRDYISIPEYKEFPTAGGKKAYGLYYPPKNPEYEDRLAASPPLIIFCHGGPTGTIFPVLDLEIQYWTSRGFVVFDVNYGGSTGFGREFRERLKGNWGIVDVDDSVNGALFLASQNLADKDAMLIRGKSAGGYTTLCALTFRKAFRAGASYYGVSDLETFAIETHKFESRYSDYLLGPLPESKQVHKERSPINYLERITAPVIFFQGLDDKVVPPAQSEAVFRALKRRGIPTAYIAFEGERHGFHDAKNIVRCFESEYFFYSAVLGFQTSGNIKPVQSIENLPRGRQ